MPKDEYVPNEVSLRGRLGRSSLDKRLHIHPMPQVAPDHLLKAMNVWRHFLSELAMEAGVEFGAGAIIFLQTTKGAAVDARQFST